MKSDVGRFAIVPEWLLDAGVSGNAVRLFAILAAKFADRDTGECTPSRATLAEAFGASTDTIDRAVRELLECRAIAVEHRFNGNGPATNQYMIFYAGPAQRGPVAGTSAAGVIRTSAAGVIRTSAAHTQNQLPEVVEAAAAMPSEEEKDLAVGRLCRAWENATGTTVTAMLGDRLADWLERLPEAAIVKAIAATGENGARAWKYTDAILTRYASEGWKDPEPKKAPAHPDLAPPSVGELDELFARRERRGD